MPIFIEFGQILPKTVWPKLRNPRKITKFGKIRMHYSISFWSLPNTFLIYHIKWPQTRTKIIILSQNVRDFWTSMLHDQFWSTFSASRVTNFKWSINIYLRQRQFWSHSMFYRCVSNFRKVKFESAFHLSRMQMISKPNNQVYIIFCCCFCWIN